MSRGTFCFAEAFKNNVHFVEVFFEKLIFFKKNDFSRSKTLSFETEVFRNARMQSLATGNFFLGMGLGHGDNPLF